MESVNVIDVKGVTIFVGRTGGLPGSIHRSQAPKHPSATTVEL